MLTEAGERPVIYVIFPARRPAETSKLEAPHAQTPIACPLAETVALDESDRDAIWRRREPSDDALGLSPGRGRPWCPNGSVRPGGSPRLPSWPEMRLTLTPNG